MRHIVVSQYVWEDKMTNKNEQNKNVTERRQTQMSEYGNKGENK